MRDYPFNYKSLTEFSNSPPYLQLTKSEQLLLDELEANRVELNFPAIYKDIGSFISFFMSAWKPKVIFEMGSGYGHSAFWYLLRGSEFIDKVILTEKRDDLKTVFNNLSWPNAWKSKLHYFEEDAFEVLEREVGGDSLIDLALIDGVKADYLTFLESVSPKMSQGGVILIDNSFWRGSFLDDEVVEKKKTAKNIRELHEFLKKSPEWESIFIPFVDGLSILKKR